MLRRLIVVVVLLQSAWGWAAPRQASAQLGTRVNNYRLSSDSFIQALTSIAAEFQIPMGIEWVKTAQSMRKVDFYFRKATIQDVLRSVVRSQPGYDLKVENGTVHIFPKRFRQDRRSFLNLPVEKFEGQDEYVAFASIRLRQQLQAIVAPRQPRQPGSGWAGSWATGLGDRKVTFRFEGVTVRDVLDGLSALADFKVWLVTYPEGDRVTPAGFYRVISISNDAVTDEGQPVWDLLLWGYDPVSKELRPLPSRQ